MNKLESGRLYIFVIEKLKNTLNDGVSTSIRTTTTFTLNCRAANNIYGK